VKNDGLVNIDKEMEIDINFPHKLQETIERKVDPGRVAILIPKKESKKIISFE